MSHWFSPFPLPEIVVVQLEQACLEPVTELPVEQEEPVLLLYNTPDRLLDTTDLEGSDLLDGYRTLLAAPVTSPRLTVWRLAALDAEQLVKILSGDPPPDFSADLPPPEPEPLAALVTAAVCRSVPGLLDAYLDLELQALLGGGEPDSAYLRRLQSRISAEGLLQAWRSPGALAHQVADLREQLVQSNGLLEDTQKDLAEANQKLEQQDTSLQEAREEAELTLLQLHQVQEELEHYFLSKGLLEDTQKALAEANQKLEQQDTSLQEAREEAELTLLQLHQVQEELEHYFLKVRASEHLAQAQMEQLQRAQGLLLRLHPNVLPIAPYPPAYAVQVLPPVTGATPNSTLQSEALLSTYAASLQRASALLQRARRP